MKSITKVLTERGYRVFLTLLGCGGLAALFIDPFLVVLASGIGGLILYDYKKAKDVADKMSSLIKLNSKSIREVLVAGKEKTIELSCQVNTNLQLNLSSPLKEAKLEPTHVRKGEYTLVLSLSPEVSGDYSADRLKVEVLGPRKFTRKEGDISFNLDVKVFPRVMAALIQAALFFLRKEKGSVGDIATTFKGPGTEYADTREYVPGDTLHHLDWKATARSGKLMVKEFFQEAGQGAHIVYDTRAIGPVSQDKLATCFLNTCLGVVEQGYPAGVSVHDGEKILLHSTGDNPDETLKMVMRYILQSMKVEFEEIDTLVDPVSSSEIRRFLSKVKEEQVREFLEFEAKVLGDRLGKPYRFLTQLSHRLDEERQFLLISQLSGEMIELLEFAEKIQSRHQLTIIQPTEPWREAKDLEQAYRWHERQRKVEEILTRHRIAIVKQLIS